ELLQVVRSRVDQRGVGELLERAECLADAVGVGGVADGRLELPVLLAAPRELRDPALAEPELERGHVRPPQREDALALGLRRLLALRALDLAEPHPRAERCGEREQTEGPAQAQLRSSCATSSRSRA